MDNSKEFQSMLNEAIVSNPSDFNDFDKTQNVQDQLQQMMLPIWEMNFWRYADGRYRGVHRDGMGEILFACDYDSMEQLWLAFVMKEKYGKEWKDNDWTKCNP